MKKAEKSGEFYYVNRSAGTAIVGYCGNGTKIRFPGEIDGFCVTEIGPEVFGDASSGILEVDVPGSVERIDAEAFAGCLSLHKLTLHEGLRSIGKDFMRFAGLERLTIPSTVKKIGDPENLCGLRLIIAPGNPVYSTDGRALYRTEGKRKILAAVLCEDDRESYDIAEGTTDIAAHAFCGHPHLHSITLPESLAEIGEYALDNGNDTCGSGLRDIFIAPGNSHFRVEGGFLFHHLKDGTEELLKYTGKDSLVCIPEGVTCIGPRALHASEATEVHFPKSTRSVGEGALKACVKLETIVIEKDGAALFVPPLVFRKEEITNLLGNEADGSIFRYAAYDALAESYPYTEVRMRMAFCRFDAPVNLSKEARNRYREYIAAHLKAVLGIIAGQEDTKSLIKLEKYEFFNAGNLPDAVEFLSAAGHPVITEMVLQYQFGHFGSCRPDLEL